MKPDNETQKNQLLSGFKRPYKKIMELRLHLKHLVSFEKHLNLSF